MGWRRQPQARRTSWRVWPARARWTAPKKPAGGAWFSRTHPRCAGGVASGRGGAEESQRILDELRFFLDHDTQRGVKDGSWIPGHPSGYTHSTWVWRWSGRRVEGAPSLRVFLLDYLATVDGAGAADYAQQVLSSPSSADEWAVAMRNYAWGKRTAESRSYLEAKFTEMVQNESWRERPSAGFLEAFDVAVYVGAPGLGCAPLMELIGQTNNPAAAHAAFLALDRMTLKDSGRDARGDAAATRSDERP